MVNQPIEEKIKKNEQKVFNLAKCYSGKGKPDSSSVRVGLDTEEESLVKNFAIRKINEVLSNYVKEGGKPEDFELGTKVINQIKDSAFEEIKQNAFKKNACYQYVDTYVKRWTSIIKNAHLLGEDDEESLNLSED